MNACVRFAVMAVIVAVSTASSVFAADADYWPLKQGAKWQYVMKVANQSVPLTMQVTNTETSEGQQLAQVDTLVNGNVTASEQYAMSTEGIFRRKMNGVEVTPAVPVIKYPVNKGDTWSVEATVANEKFKADSSVDTQDVTVPAGTYQAAVVTTETTVPTGKLVSKQWFAPGVGLVKQEVQLPQGSVNMELEKYEAAK